MQTMQRPHSERGDPHVGIRLLRMTKKETLLRMTGRETLLRMTKKGTLLRMTERETRTLSF